MQTSDPCPETCDMPTPNHPAETTHSSTGPGRNMTYAQALTDARTLIVQQSARIKSDAQKIKAQQDEIAQLRSDLESTTDEVQRLRPLEPQLAEAQAGRDQAEAMVGRQRVEIESLETASRELQKMLGEQAARIHEMTIELEQLRAKLPTHEDVAALESMAALLSTARAGARARRPERPEQPEHPQAERQTSERQLSGPALARLQRERQYAEAVERESRKHRAAPSPRPLVIPADPTPFCEIEQR